MSQPFGLREATETIIEIVASRCQVGFSDSLSPTNLTKMAMLDVDALESDEHRDDFGLCLDWDSTMISIAEDAAKEKAIIRLGQLLVQRDDCATVYSESIETLLHEEFEPSASFTEELWRTHNVFQKVSDLCVSEHCLAYCPLLPTYGN
jgi:hypothetical protein